MTSSDRGPGVDVIGDVHGYADRLQALLGELGYVADGGAHRHRSRTAVFVGDLIDRGPSQLETLRIVRAMVKASSAEIVLGNHEFNAIAYATIDPARRDYCRTHSDKHDAQHREFLAEVGFDTPAHRDIIEWFRTIPLWLDLGGLRVVHACWSPKHIFTLREAFGGDVLTGRGVVDGTTKGTDVYDAIEVVLKGPEVSLDGAWYEDNGGHRREDARLRWWDQAATALPAAAMVPGGTTFFGRDDEPLDGPPTRTLEPEDLVRYEDPVPVLFGHYWWREDTAEPFGELAACLDYSVAAGGKLAAYRWDEGDSRLEENRLVLV